MEAMEAILFSPNYSPMTDVQMNSSLSFPMLPAAITTRKPDLSSKARYSATSLLPSRPRQLRSGIGFLSTLGIRRMDTHAAPCGIGALRTMATEITWRCLILRCRASCGAWAYGDPTIRYLHPLGVIARFCVTARNGANSARCAIPVTGSPAPNAGTYEGYALSGTRIGEIFGESVCLPNA